MTRVFFLVTADETCQTIASKYDTSVSEIESWNKEFKDFFNCDTVKAGETICVEVNLHSDRHGLSFNSTGPNI